MNSDPPAKRVHSAAGAGRARIFVVSNTAWSLSHFRLPLMLALRDADYEVCGVSPNDEYSNKLVETGFSHFEIEMNQGGKNPFEDLLLALRLVQLFRSERPDLVLTYTAKPNIYASLAARPLGIPVINTVPGLGHVFAKHGPLAWIAKKLYRLAFRGSQKVFFQNFEDLAFFVDEGLVSETLVERIAGSGVDTARFSPAETSPTSGPFVFLLVSRLLWNKGVGEFVDAARFLRAKNRDASFRILGFLDPNHPGGISQDQIQTWEREGVITYLGGTDDVTGPMGESGCIVLPSYYGEGVPRTLLEGASLAKPLIAADSPGSRDIVDHGINGFLCQPRDPMDLARQMEAMLELDEESRALMGSRGREKACREFDERLVFGRYLLAVEAALAR